MLKGRLVVHVRVSNAIRVPETALADYLDPWIRKALLRDRASSVR